MARSKTGRRKADVGRNLASLRQNVKLIDEEILHLVAMRQEVTEAIGLIKASAGIPLRDPKLEQIFFINRAQLSKSLGVSSDLTSKVFRLLLAESIRRQAKTIRAAKSSSTRLRSR